MQTADLTIDPTQTQSLTADIPAFLGGGSVTLTNCAGGFTVSLIPIPGDPEHRAIRIEKGSMTAPSFKTTNGRDTGLNTLTFKLPETSDGILQVSDGSYTASGFATIVNDLIPEGVTVRGKYSGVYNTQTGNVSMESDSTDILTLNARAVNISTRLAVGTGDNVLISGFIVTGAEAKKIIVRAIGPSLGQGGVAGTLADPTLELRNSAGVLLGSNDDWQTTQLGGGITADQVADIQASTIAPGDPKEAAILATLPPGAYTAIIRGAGNATGVGLAEVYDLSPTSASKLANISTRGLVQGGDNVMIGGFIVDRGTGMRVIVRAIGPSLGNAGVANPLADPTLQLFNGAGTLADSNDNWKSDHQADIELSELAPSNDAESAIFQTLSPGNYTAIVSGKNGTTGVGLIEVYNVQ